MSWRRLQGHQVASAAVGLFVLVVAPSAAVAQPDKDPVRGAVVSWLKQQCVSNDELRGISIQTVDDDKNAGTLKLTGWFDNPKQAALLAKEAKDRFAKIAAWGARYPNGIDADGLVELPLRSKVLKNLRLDFAQSKAVDPKHLTWLRRTRLDDVYYDAATGAVTFTGVTLHEKLPSDKVPEADPKLPPVHVLEKILSDFLETKYGLGEFKKAGIKISVDSLSFQGNPLASFQDKLSELLKDELLIQDARYDAEGLMILDGWVGKEKHASFTKLLTEHFSQHPCWRKATPRWQLDGVKERTWPLQTVVWNKNLIRTPPMIEATDPYHLVHLERLFFGYSGAGEIELRCNGYYTPAMPTAREKIFHVKLSERLQEEWARDWPELKLQLASNISMAYLNKIRPRHPANLIQRDVYHQLNLSDVLIDHGWIDEQGNVQIRAMVGKKEHIPILRKWLARRFDKADPGDQPAPWLQEEFKVVDWPATIKPLQKALAAAQKDVVSETRLDDVAFTFSADDTFEIRFAGICINQSFGRDDKAADKTLGAFLQDELGRLWPSLSARQFGVASVAAIQRTAGRPEYDLQQLLQSNVSLDGIMIQTKSTFDAAGQFIVAGFWQGPHQEAAFRKLIGESYESKANRPNQNGVVLQFVNVATHQVLQKLREIAYTQLTETRVDRLYVDEVLTIRLRGICVDPASETKLYQQLAEILPTIPNGQNMLNAQSPKKDVKPGDFKVTPSVVLELRKRLIASKDPALEGILIERGSYAPDGALALTGLIDHTDQNKELAKLLDELAKDPKWADPLAAGARFDSLQVVPMAPIVAALRRTMPDYPELDHIKIDRFRHSETGALVAEGFAIKGAHRADKAQEVIEKLIKGHPQWNKRVQHGLAPVQLELVDRNEVLARTALYRALKELQEQDPYPLSFATQGQSGGPGAWQGGGYPPGWCCVPGTPGAGAGRTSATSASSTTATATRKRKISAAVLDRCLQDLDVALFHTTDQSLAWFLRGTCWLGKGEPEVTKRDFRRMHRIESMFPEQQQERLSKVENFQGDLRVQAARLALQAELQHAGGYRPAVLAAGALDVRRP